MRARGRGCRWVRGALATGGVQLGTARYGQTWGLLYSFDHDRGLSSRLGRFIQSHPTLPAAWLPHCIIGGHVQPSSIAGILSFMHDEQRLLPVFVECCWIVVVWWVGLPLARRAL
jgi:hypothetical protein